MKTLKYGILSLLLAACVQGVSVVQKRFDFETFLDEQASKLSQRGGVLEKTAHMGSESSDTTFLPTNEGWKRELELYGQMEILNKPAYQSAYTVRDSLKDTKSNLKIREYTSELAPMTHLRFFYQDEFKRIRRIEAEITERNILYTTQRHLTLYFEDEEHEPLLSKYEMDGFEKMILSDTVKFSIMGQIDW